MVAGSPSFQLAQINIAKALAPLDSPLLAEFISALDPINKLAEESLGFVWRLKDDTGNATHIQLFDDPMIIVNMSVWETREALFDYVYKSAHTAFLSRRKEWFTHLDRPYVALWWIKAGHVPTLMEAKEKLELIQKYGPTAEAFTLKKYFPSPDIVVS